MKTTFFNLITLGFLLILLSNCSKDRIEPKDEPLLNQYSSNNLNDFYNTYKQPEQEFEITQDGNGPIIGNQGTKIWAPKSIFMKQDSSDIDYPYTIKLIELYKPKDMILYNMPTISAGNILVTDGEIRVRAFKDGQELLLKPYHTYTAFMPSTSPSSQMQIFYGKNAGSYTDWTSNLSAVNSTPNLDSIASITVVSDSTQNGYMLNIPQMNWINCDYFYGSSEPLTSISFMSETDELTNIDKFIYFDQIHSVMQVYGNTSGLIPIGTSAKIICFAKNSSGIMYWYKQDVIVSNNLVINVVMTETSDTDLLNYLAGL